MTSERRRKHPLEVPRPERRTSTGERPAGRRGTAPGEIVHTASGGVIANGHQAMLKLALQRQSAPA